MRHADDFKYRLLWVGLICLLGISTTNARMYKWIDDEGETHYTQSPPPDDIKGQVIEAPSRIDSEMANKKLEAQQKEVDTLKKDRYEQNDAKMKAESEMAQQKEICKQAKSRLTSYERPRVSVVNEDGGRSRIGEDERQKKLIQAREEVAEYCK